MLCYILQALFDFKKALEGGDEILKSAGWKHDSIAAPTDIFSDFQETPPLVFFEIKKENLSINLKLFGRERVICPLWCVGITHILRCLRSFWNLSIYLNVS
jgi:hypothetical protein